MHTLGFQMTSLYVALITLHLIICWHGGIECFFLYFHNNEAGIQKEKLYLERNPWIFRQSLLRRLHFSLSVSLISAEVFLQEHNSDYPECPLTVAQDKSADHNRWGAAVVSLVSLILLLSSSRTLLRWDFWSVMLLSGPGVVVGGSHWTYIIIMEFLREYLQNQTCW